MSSHPIIDWIKNELYSELCQMPLWTVSAFGNLNDGDILQPDDVRFRLIKYLVNNHQRNAPAHLGSHDGYKYADFVPSIKQAVITCKNILAKNIK